MISPLKGAKAIERKTKCNITVVTEEFVSLMDPSNCYVFLFELFVVFAIKDILNGIFIRNEIGLICISTF